MKLLTSPQGEILQFLMKMGGVTIFALNKSIVTSLEKRGFVSIINDLVEITVAGENFYKAEVNAGRKALKKQIKDFRI